MVHVHENDHRLLLDLGTWYNNTRMTSLEKNYLILSLNLVNYIFNEC